jgi:hypothetical protein
MIGMVAGFTLEWWPDANRNPGRLNLGICIPGDETHSNFGVLRTRP